MWPIGMSVDEAALDLSATDVAVAVMFAFDGIVAGAVYVAAAPLGVVTGAILPHCVAEQDSVHVTPPLLASLATLAVSRAVEAAGTAAIVGEIDTVIEGACNAVGPLGSVPLQAAATSAARVTPRQPSTSPPAKSPAGFIRRSARTFLGRRRSAH